MSAFDKILAPLTSEKVEKKAQTFYKVGKLGMLCGLIAMVLLILSVLITLMIGRPSWVEDLLILDIDDDFFFMYPIMILSYLGILFGAVGVGLYFYGINLFALGRIAHNTEKD